MPTIKEVHVPVSTLRQDVKIMQDAFDRVHTYANAVALQHAKEALENFFKNERSYFVVIPGDSRPNRLHVPPTTFRVIDGGRT